MKLCADLADQVYFNDTTSKEDRLSIRTNVR